MATKTWAGGTSNVWTLAANWTGGVPVAGDDVVIAAAGANAPTVSASTSIGSLSFTGTNTKALTLANAATVLTVTGIVPTTTFGVNFTGTGGVIAGIGTINATNGINVATGGSATITTGGTLTLTGVLSKSGTGTLALSIANSNDILALTSAGSNVTSVAFTGSTRTLQLGANATLAVANSMTLSGANNLVTLGGSNSALTAPSFTISDSGTISGAGTVTGAVSATGSGSHTAQITATGGTLIMVNAVTGNLALTVTGASDTLKFNAAGNAANSLTLNGGTLQLNGATAALSVTSSTTLGTGTIAGFGTFTGTVAAGASAGHITANGGTLVMASQITGTALLLSDTASTDTLWRRLAERAETVGQPASSPETTKDPQLCIVVEGRTVRPVHCKNGLYTFALPKGATEIRLVSRAGSPTDARPWLNDRRSLGVNVERIVLRSEREVRIVPLDQPGLSQGWWPVEQDGIALSRWTNAEAVVSLPSMDGPAMLEIRAGCGEMSYLVTAAQASLAA